MKNTFKRVLAVVMVAAMLATALCFVGCGEEKGNETYFIGATGPLTGDAADYGIAVNNGAKSRLTRSTQQAVSTAFCSAMR